MTPPPIIPWLALLADEVTTHTEQLDKDHVFREYQVGGCRFYDNRVSKAAGFQKLKPFVSYGCEPIIYNTEDELREAVRLLLSRARQPT
jgi:hypothetical protein